MTASPAKKKPVKNFGITMLKHLKDRSVVTDDGHWLWSLGSMHNDGKTPLVSVGKACKKVPNLAGKRAAGRRVAHLLNGGELKSGWVVYSTCNHPMCLSPHHVAAGPREEAVSHAVESGAFRTPAKRAAHTKNGEAKRKLTDQQAREVAAMSGTVVEIAEKMGVSREVVRRIRRRETYVSALPRGSVFDLAWLMGGDPGAIGRKEFNRPGKAVAES